MTYAFGDTDLARERLALVADTFEAPTRALLADLPAAAYRYVIDMGCGPGFTTALLREAIPHSFTTGIDASAAMIAEARGRVADAHFVVADVTAALSLPAQLVYARLLLGHLPDPAAAVAAWAAALRPGGVVACEEPVRYRSADPVFARYEEAVTAIVAARGATLWAGPALDTDRIGEFRRVAGNRERVVAAQAGHHVRDFEKSRRQRSGDPGRRHAGNSL